MIYKTIMNVHIKGQSKENCPYPYNVKNNWNNLLLSWRVPFEEDFQDSYLCREVQVEWFLSDILKVKENLSYVLLWMLVR